MDEPFLGEIRMFSFGAVPSGWEICYGQALEIAEHRELFHLLGTHYGGDGRTHFRLPNLECRMPIHRGSLHPLGASGGLKYVELTTDQMPVHAHTGMASSGTANEGSPSENVYLATASVKVYKPPEKDALMPMNAGTIATEGEDDSHENMMPYLNIQFCIAVKGTVPARS